eukprot:363062-Chlamydomonas_euryale.AAC.11
MTRLVHAPREQLTAADVAEAIHVQSMACVVGRSRGSYARARFMNSKRMIMSHAPDHFKIVFNCGMSIHERDHPCLVLLGAIWVVFNAALGKLDVLGPLAVTFAGLPYLSILHHL